MGHQSPEIGHELDISHEIVHEWDSIFQIGHELNNRVKRLNMRGTTFMILYICWTTES
jgi:hypothetical protein